MDEALNSSNKMDWGTPLDFYNKLKVIFGEFDLDPCTNDNNRLSTPCYYNKFMNGLEMPWFGKVFCNPPYGRGIKNWVKKAYNERKNCKLIVLLIPSRTDTKYWHKYIMKANIIYLVKGRIIFNNDNKNKFFENYTPAPFPSCVVVYDNNNNNPLMVESL